MSITKILYKSVHKKLNLIVFVSFFIIQSFLFNTSTFASNDELTVEEVSSTLRPPKLITLRNQRNLKGDPIPSPKPGDFFIRTGQQNCANNQLAEYYREKKNHFDYFHLQAEDIKVQRTLNFSGHYYGGDNKIVIARKLISGDNALINEMKADVFFTLNYWTHYHPSSSLVNYSTDTYENYNQSSYSYYYDNYDFTRLGSKLAELNYDNYGKFRKKGSKKNLKDAENEIYKTIQTEFFNDTESLFKKNSEDSEDLSKEKSNKYYILKDEKKLFFKPTRHNYNLAARTNTIATGITSTNFGEVRLSTPRSWLRNYIKDNYEDKDVEKYELKKAKDIDTLSASQYNKLIIEQYTKLVFSNNNYGQFSIVEDTHVNQKNIYDTLPTHAFIHIPSGGLYSTHFAVQSCKVPGLISKLKDTRTSESNDKEIKTLETLTAFDVIKDLQNMAQSKEGVYTESANAFDTKESLKDFYSFHTQKDTFDTTYKKNNNSASNTDSFSIWWLPYYFVAAYLGIMEKTQKEVFREDFPSTKYLPDYNKEIFSNTGCNDHTHLKCRPFLSINENKNFEDFEKELNEKTIKLFSKFYKSIKTNILNQFEGHQFMRTLFNYVLYYIAQDNKRVRSCKDLKQEIYKAFYLNNVLGSDNYKKSKKTATFFHQITNYNSKFGIENDDKDHAGKIYNKKIKSSKRSSYYGHKWWEHTNIDFSCMHLKKLLTDPYNITSQDKNKLVKIRKSAPFNLSPYLGRPKGKDAFSLRFFIAPPMYKNNFTDKTGAHFQSNLAQELFKGTKASKYLQEYFFNDDFINTFSTSDSNDESINNVADLMVDYFGHYVKLKPHDSGNDDIDEAETSVNIQGDSADDLQCNGLELNEDKYIQSTSNDGTITFLNTPEAKKILTCRHAHWTAGWAAQKQFYKNLKRILKSVAELDDLQIKINAYQHHVVDCSGSNTFDFTPNNPKWQWGKILSSASLDTVQDFGQKDKNPITNYDSKHPESDYAINSSLKKLYYDPDYITFKTSLNNPPGRPMIVIPGTKFIPPKIFDYQPKKRSGISVQAYPRAICELVEVSKTEKTKGPGTPIDVGHVPHNCKILNKTRKEILGTFRNKIHAAYIQEDPDLRDKKIDEIIKHIDDNKECIEKIPEHDDIILILTTPPGQSITISN